MLEMEKVRKKDKKTVLWVSNDHKPLPAQIDELERIFGEVEVKEMIEFVPNAKYVMNKAKEVDADVIVPVLPMTFVTRLVELARQKITVLWAKMVQVHECKSVKCPEFNPNTDTTVPGRDKGRPVIRHFRFQKFEEILGLNFITRDPYSHKCVVVVKLEVEMRDVELIESDLHKALQEVIKQHGIDGDVIIFKGG